MTLVPPSQQQGARDPRQKASGGAGGISSGAAAFAPPGMGAAADLHASRRLSVHAAVKRKIPAGCGIFLCSLINGSRPSLPAGNQLHEGVIMERFERAPDMRRSMPFETRC